MRGRGRSNAISMSNTRNRILSKKNRIEKGIREFDIGSNPHSNGVVFSRSCEDLKFITIRLRIMREIRVVNRRIRKMGIICRFWP